MEYVLNEVTFIEAYGIILTIAVMILLAYALTVRGQRDWYRDLARRYAPESERTSSENQPCPKRHMLMTKYTLVERFEIRDLEAAVNKLLSEGWELQGGVSMGQPAQHELVYRVYAQALVKR